MAHSEGFEPSTARFVAEYSIQLSYECVDGAYNRDLPSESQRFFQENFIIVFSYLERPVISKEKMKSRAKYQS